MDTCVTNRKIEECLIFLSALLLYLYEVFVSDESLNMSSQQLKQHILGFCQEDCHSVCGDYPIISPAARQDPALESSRITKNTPLLPDLTTSIGTFHSGRMCAETMKGWPKALHPTPGTNILWISGICVFKPYWVKWAG